MLKTNMFYRYYEQPKFEYFVNFGLQKYLKKLQK